MAGNALHLFVTVLAFSFLASLIGLSSSSKYSTLCWAINLVHERQGIPSPEDTLQMNKAENPGGNMEIVENEVIHGRMDFEINRDYPGSGANNRHTPYPPVKD
ncbi:hypothetical protein DH2020_049918 [Rehmannia glutinosa]|uniref:Uncharacterized protein n=1 Tax=Rehmannia glutinosa TaxID=99300 RepID=A0ABR0U2N4_REHGL